MTNAEEKFLADRPLFCEECGGKMFYQYDGIYQCNECGKEQLDDFGKIREYLEKNPGSTAVVISQETKVDLGIVSMFLKDGRIQIPTGSRIYIKCEKCGCSLRYGRYCEECTRELAGAIKSAMLEDAAKKPRITTPRTNHPRMRYFHYDK